LSNTTTGSDRVVPGQQPPEESRASRLTRFTGSVAAHWQFAIVVAVAVVMRIIVILGYPPILWFDDSYNYIYDAFTHRPDVIRTNGYPFFLQLLLPLHSAYPIGLVQAAMGVAMGIVIYALLRRRGLEDGIAVISDQPGGAVGQRGGGSRPFAEGCAAVRDRGAQPPPHPNLLSARRTAIFRGRPVGIRADLRQSPE